MSILNRVIITSGLFLGTITAFSPTAFAQTTSDTVNLSGNVQSILDMTTTATAAASNLDLPISADTKVVQVADIAFETNNAEGLTITATSGTLTTNGGQTPIDFQVKLLADGTAIPGSTDFASGNTTHTTTSAGTGAADLYIKYTTAEYQDPGTYSGTISLTVIDNS
ncbi:hypothetical protein IQ230_15280 [Gloeocapsopsis crepidinum LEGE 06123]|uniref:Uncharacterized protein n=1 Tax=Gloeocapsopsis crepidinum LEGE 06123 TaxID=588587 RepID=A0ABR9UTQ5_9CHRO|nr:hypothetical protein [Gloeocapsopsis crepidinum]MBE9191685.1 hypothetical protein [Gloeocapsopsis crepidinum LEGE 06123]